MTIDELTQALETAMRGGLTIADFHSIAQACDNAEQLQAHVAVAATPPRGAVWTDEGLCKVPG